MQNPTGSPGNKSRAPSKLDNLVPADHPLRRARHMTDVSLSALYEWLRLSFLPPDRCPIEPEKLVRAIMLQVMYAIPGDQQLVERVWYSLLFRWFVGIEAKEGKWEVETFARHRQQLLDHNVVREMIARVLAAVDRDRIKSLGAESAGHHDVGRVGAIASSLPEFWRLGEVAPRAHPGSGDAARNDGQWDAGKEAGAAAPLVTGRRRGPRAWPIA
jgi:transposase